MTDKKIITFKGERLKDFLRRKEITYKEASEIVKLDKNTIGKFANGGNMNVNALLSICNGLNIPVNYFFSIDSTYDDSLSTAVDEILEDSKVVNEGAGEYKSCESNNFYIALLKSKDEEILSMRKMLALLNSRMELLQKELLDSKSQTKTY